MTVDFNKNHFELFGLQPGFSLDAEALDQAYRDLQGEIHPDRFAHAGEADQRLAVQWATRANEAYKTLKSPFERARYLLELQGIHALDAKNTRMPPAFLVQQMEWRETLAEAVAARDFAALQRLEQATRTAAQGMLAELGELLDVLHDYPGAAEAVRKYRFLEKFLADIDTAYEEIG
jgi:molecular chaperone HscB